MYDAITIDTQVVETNSYDFDGGLLAQLKQFKDGPVKVVVSNVVEMELLSHLKDKIAQAKDAVLAAHKKALLYGLKSQREEAFQDEIDPEALSKKRLAQYFGAIGAEVLTNDVSAQALLKSYFQSKPPFNSAKKKSEFPDAIALMSIEAWAEENDAKVIAVSGDSDWLSYTGKRLTVVATLVEALAELQLDVARASQLLEAVLQDIEGEGKNYDILFAEIERQLGDFDIMAEADGSLSFEDEGTSLTLTGVHILGDEEPTIVQVGTSKIVVNIDLILTLDAETSFGMNAWDSIDKDYVYMGSMNATQEDVEFTVGALVTLEGDLDTGTLEITDVDVLTKSHALPYGELHPDFRDEDFEPSESGDDEEQEEPDETPEPDEERI